jgi:hypothetical protein
MPSFQRRAAMSDGNGDRKVYIVNFVLETPRHKCAEVLEDLPCKLKHFHRRARTAVISVKPKNEDEVRDALAREPLVTKFHLQGPEKKDPQ